MNITTVYSPHIERISPFLYKVAGFQVDMRNGRAIDCTCRVSHCQHRKIAEQSEEIHGEHNTAVSCECCGQNIRARRDRAAICWKCSW